MTAIELRQKYLDFFKKKGHEIVSSASLLPENDPTTLFTGSGMQPMVPYLLGEKYPGGSVRVANSQKCFRTSDIEEVGDNTHTTFFEMLGNWSFGDYFKEKQIMWIFEFLTEELDLDPERLYVSVYQGNEDLNIDKDTEAVELWKQEFDKKGINARAVFNVRKNGMQDGRIFYYGNDENWWSRVGEPENMPIGEPGGTDSEMFWDLGENLKFHENSKWSNDECHPNCDCGRFVEIGNNVFMKYMRTPDGFEELENKNIDFGGGLERMLIAVEDNPDIFACEIFDKIRTEIEIVSGKKYGENDDDTRAFRVIMDHLRGSVFLINDGAIPSNKDQGYFTRRLIRRSIRFGHQLGVESNFTKIVASSVVETYKEYYKDILDNSEKIYKVINEEEEKFRKTLKKGEIILDKLKKEEMNGTTFFDLFQTYGYPFEMTVEAMEEKGVEYNEKWIKEFQDAQEKHQELSRTASSGKFKGGLADDNEITTQLHTVTHLMLAGLRDVLGNHVEQRGSNITAERIRFDFSHDEKLTDEERIAVEAYVNKALGSKAMVELEEMSKLDAQEMGVLGVFWEKYPDQVKVYTVKDDERIYSRELCGGPHIESVDEIKGVFKLKKEKSSGAGVRRIKAVIE
ncbi:MAG: alanine--tRNA ligase [Candidatus Moraniibacteriota bacterium]|jgi:alanyl-tRNA synthetase